MDSRNDFLNPPARYRGVTLWMLNGKLTKEGLNEQLEAFHRGGWGAVIARTFPGLQTEYLSDEYMEMTQSLVKRADELGMRTWLQAGYMPGAVPNLPEDIQYHGLVVRAKDGSDFGSQNEALQASSYAGSGEGFEEVAEDEDHVYSCGRMPEVLDLLNGPAVIQYLDDAYKKPWYDRLGEQFGSTIEAIWVDEPHFRPQLLPWSKNFPEVFEERFGYDISEHIPSLFFEKGDWNKIRHQYWRTIVEMFMDGYFTHVESWCTEHNVKFAGHLMGEDSLMSQIAWTGATMQAYEHMQLPGIDHLTMDLKWPIDKKFILTPKQATSVANQLNKKEVLAEIYAVSSHRITFQDRKRIFNWMAVLGISYRCNHAAFYSMRGDRKRMYVPQLGFQQPWWEDNRVLADYCARISWFMQQGYRHSDVLVIHPQETAFCLYDPRKDLKRTDRTGKINEFNSRLIDLCDTLLGLQRDFEFGDEALMAKHAELTEQEITIGRIAYKLVVLPDMMTIRKTTLDLLNAFTQAGGSILSVGILPDRVDGVEKEALDESTVAALETLLSSVKKVQADRIPFGKEIDAAIDAPFSLSAEKGIENIWVQHRIIDGRIGLMLVNTSATDSFAADLRINSAGRLETWDLDSGDKQLAPCSEVNSGVVTPIALVPDTACLFMLNPDEKPESVTPEIWSDTQVIPLNEKPQVRRLAPNTLPLDMARYRCGTGEWSLFMATVMIQKKLKDDQYNGPLTIEYSFEVADVPGSVALVVEDPQNYEITLNGNEVSTAAPTDSFYIDPSFKTLPVSFALQEGSNLAVMTCEYRAIDTSTSGLQGQHEARAGSEIEAVYIVGDFAVDGIRSDETPDTSLRYTSRQLIKEKNETGWNLSGNGYPFFTGRVVLSDTLTLEAAGKGEKIFLALADMKAPIARVKINHQDAGLLVWDPLELDITGLIVAGENLVEIEFASSLRNALGPFHREAGEPDSCWRNAWDDLTGVTAFEHADEASVWTDDYFVIHFGALKTPNVVVRKKTS